MELLATTDLRPWTTFPQLHIWRALSTPGECLLERPQNWNWTKDRKITGLNMNIDHLLMWTLLLTAWPAQGSTALPVKKIWFYNLTILQRKLKTILVLCLRQILKSIPICLFEAPTTVAMCGKVTPKTGWRPLCDVAIVYKLWLKFDVLTCSAGPNTETSSSRTRDAGGRSLPATKYFPKSWRFSLIGSW